MNWVKIIITGCSDRDKYKHLIGHHGMAFDETTRYRISHLATHENIYVKKEDAQLTETIGRNF